MKVSPDILLQVAYDNQRDHQLGGVTDGINRHTAEDIGFTLPDDVIELEIAPANIEPDAGTVRNLGRAVVATESLTSAEKNRNERKHIAEARQLRRRSLGF